MGSKKKVSQVRSSKGRTKAKTGVERIARSDTRSLPKPHIGFEAFVEPLAQLAEKFAAELGAGGIDVELMRSAFRHYQSLAPAHQAAVDELASVDSTRLFDASTTWVQMLLIYGTARQAGRWNASVRGAIEPFADFMKIGPRKSRKTTPTTPSVPSSGTSQP